MPTSTPGLSQEQMAAHFLTIMKRFLVEADAAAGDFKESAGVDDLADVLGLALGLGFEEAIDIANDYLVYLEESA